MSRDVLFGRATRSDEKSGTLQMFDVAWHDAPGRDNGIYLDQPDKGWQLRAEAFPPA